MGCFDGFMGNGCKEKDCGCGTKDNGFFGGNIIWLLLLLCCCGDCICEILPLLLILNCVCGKKCC